MRELKVKVSVIVLFVSVLGMSQGKLALDSVGEHLDFVVYRMLQNDSITEARMLLDTALKNKGDTVDENFLVTYNYNYGLIFLSSGKYKESLSYIKRAKELSNTIAETPYAEELSTTLLRIYREAHLYENIDSLFSKVVTDAEGKKNRTIFYNYIDYVISCTDRKQYDKVIDITRTAINAMDKYDFSKEKAITVYSVDTIVRNELKLHQAIALIEEKKEYKKSYTLLNELEKDSLYFTKREREEFLRLVTQYKSRYFFEYQKNLDSVFYYQTLSNNYREKYIKDLKVRALQADQFIYEIAKNKNDLEKLSIINKKNIQLQNNYFHISFLIGFLLLLAIIFCIYVYRSSEQKSSINQELAQKNKELLVLDEERSRFFSVISHELRTPIYTIQGLIEATEKSKDEENRGEAIKTLKFFNYHLSGLVNNALEYTKFSLGNVHLNSEPFILNTLLKEICNSFSYQLIQNNTELHLDIEENIETEVLGDRIKLSQVFINLISNAIKFTVDGNIWLKVIQLYSDEHLVGFRFTIEDDGEGIKKDLQANIFDGFTSTKHISKNKGGSGLGLYIVKKIIEELYGSKILMKSALGKGTSFSFDIEMQKNINTPIIEEDDFHDVLKGHTILVVDDNTVNLMITKKTLEDVGANCTTVSNGFDAVDLVRTNTYDIVFMDIHMPEQDGLETTLEIRKFNQKVVVLALTAVDLEDVIAKTRESGMNGIITKPYKKSEMFQKILSFSLK
ncbi:response regulator [Aquimarina sp. 2201CG1-2-11]|uniref:hybrid sensor histidine kinase/response regulator n=1 Tax=Aquimarina discodermiae TaxID=3231043 RepID=UPI0034634474